MTTQEEIDEQKARVARLLPLVQESMRFTFEAMKSVGYITSDVPEKLLTEQMAHLIDLALVKPEAWK